MIVLAIVVIVAASVLGHQYATHALDPDARRPYPGCKCHRGDRLRITRKVRTDG